MLFFQKSNKSDTQGVITMGKNFRETLAEQMKQTEFQAEWNSLEQEFQKIKDNLQTTTDTNIPKTKTNA